MQQGHRALSIHALGLDIPISLIDTFTFLKATGVLAGEKPLKSLFARQDPPAQQTKALAQATTYGAETSTASAAR